MVICWLFYGWVCVNYKSKICVFFIWSWLSMYFVVRVGKFVWCMFDWDEDMMSMGIRYLFLVKYKVFYVLIICVLCVGFILVFFVVNFWDVINVFSF